MRSILPLLLLSSSSLISLSTSLPFTLQKPALRPRAKYSVVAVDGGSGDSPTPTGAEDDKPPSATIIQTEDHTKTVTASATPLPPSTSIVTATKVVTEESPAKTVQVDKPEGAHESQKPSPKPKIQIVNVAGDLPPSKQTTTTTQIVTSSTITSASSIPSSTYSSTYASSPTLISSVFPAAGTPSASSSVVHDSSSPTTPHPTPSSSNLVYLHAQQAHPTSPVPTHSSISAASTSKSYDDGKWHTTYSSWNATTTANSGSYRTVKTSPMWTKR